VARHRRRGVDVAEVRGHAGRAHHVEHGDVGDGRVELKEHGEGLPNPARAADHAYLLMFGGRRETKPVRLYILSVLKRLLFIKNIYEASSLTPIKITSIK
jgi:hypothetical protein